MNIYEQICQTAEALQPELSAQRRDFHKYAETGWFEMRTSSIIARKLTDLGYEVLVGEAVCDREARMGVADAAELERQYARAVAQGGDPEFLPATREGMTGVIGILRCGEGPTVAMRFDIDALGVIEAEDDAHIPAKEGFRSVNPGFMHACGHDGHATVGLGVAKVLMEIKDQLHGTVKLIFQPAEEGVRGAKSIVEKGHLDGVQYLLGSHITGKKEGDPAHLTPGSYGSLATCKYDVTYTGAPAHAGAAPQGGHNALVAAASAVLNLNAIPRHSGGATRINVGTLHAGSGRNVIPDEAKMEIEVRGATTELNRYMCEKAETILKHTAEMYGCSCQIHLMGAADSLTSDESLARRVETVAREKLGLIPSEKRMIPSFGSEDFAYMMNRVQEQGGEATFIRALTPCAGAAHTRVYDFGEEVLVNSVKIFCGTAADILNA